VRILRLAATPLLAAFIAGCVTISGDGGLSSAAPGQPGQPGEPGQPATTPQALATVGTQPGGSSQGLCALFTPDEIAAYVGTPVDRGLANSQVQTCVWSALEGDGYVLVQQIPAEYYEEHSLSAGYHKITGIGEEASIESALLGQGLALTVRSGEFAYFVDLVPAADDEAVIALGRDFITRAGGQP
jgi:hypothetical protein